MTEIRAKKIWRNGELVDWDKATVHVMSHALHYGSSWFEGIRCYKTARGSEVFRLPEHVNRLYDSCKIYRASIPFTQQEFIDGVLETIEANELEQCYIRPLVFRGAGAIGVNPLPAPIETYIIVWEWGKYLGEDAIESGVDLRVSSWHRAAPNTFPTMAKAGGNYLNSGLIKMEAVLDGFVEGIALDSEGFVSEGSGENLFLIRKGKLFTSPLASAILPGITRDSVITLARDAGFDVIEERIPREMLYLADELFLTGTAAEVTPVRSVDHIVIGEGKRGSVTTIIQRSFFDYVQGKIEDRFGWMTPVKAGAKQRMRVADR
ncbi:MAG: branched-chain amino acid transaminase [Acidobacteria bacterium]|nr:MAG: branched-chain amino acid transaminase [Acidobacteriota bacterium]